MHFSLLLQRLFVLFYKCKANEREAMRNDTNTDKIKELMKNGEATKMIDALVKANPAKAAEAAEVRFQVQKERFQALRTENPVRCTYVGVINKDTLDPLMSDKPAYLDAVIDLIEKHKVDHPDFNLTKEEMDEELKRKFMDKKVEEAYLRINAARADTRHAVQSQKDTEGEMLLFCIAVGVAATALGASSLAVASIGTACIISDYMKELEPARKHMLNGAQELTKDEYKVMVRAEAKERGAEAPSAVR